ncbi:hypothetical protein FJT64_015913 [Amphibalanus amphitrite]|uniref:Uncharacterized protein n=1 Tax=Amphibalanus amphitrite TaxID=1232801 RepID=A0A6A4XG01_AMPAM|nr:hypothetical protein FJT64_015913 [Amphibalanus amphitrite]
MGRMNSSSNCVAAGEAALPVTTWTAGLNRTVHQLRTLTGAPEAVCPRLLSFGGSCMCAFSDRADLSAQTVQFDRHVSGRRELCVGGAFLRPDRCSVLSLQSGTVSGEQRRLADALTSFGCADGQVALVSPAAEEQLRWERFSLRRLMRRRGLARLDVLDVSVEGREQAVLAEVVAAAVSPRQVSLTVVLDRGQAEGDESTFREERLGEYVLLLRQLRAAGYRLASYNANGRCVEYLLRRTGLDPPLRGQTGLRL